MPQAFQACTRPLRSRSCRISSLIAHSGAFAQSQVLVAFACCYVLLCAVGMNWCLDRIRVYLRDCLALRMCSVCIPMVSVLRGLRFTCGVTVSLRGAKLSGEPCVYKALLLHCC
jgi:hypothetical protein